MRSPGPSFFSLPTTAATSRGRSCLWMAASHRCRPSLVNELFMVCGSAGGRVLRRLPQPTGTLPAPGDLERLQAGFEGVQQVDPLEPILPAQRLARELRDFVKRSQGRAVIWRGAEDRPAIRRW